MKHLVVLKNLIKNDSVLLLKLEFGGVFSVPDLDFEIRGGEGAFRPQFGLKIRGPPSPWSATGFSCLREEKYNKNTQRKTSLCKEGH